MSDVPVPQSDKQLKVPGQCMHTPCSCASDNVSDLYCSEVCKLADQTDVENTEQGPCGCGHPGCN